MENKENIWKDISNVQEQFILKQVKLKWSPDEKTPSVKWFELITDDDEPITIKYIPVKHEEVKKTIMGFEGIEDVVRPIYLTEVDEFFPQYKRLKSLTMEGKKPKIQLEVKRMEKKTGEVFYKFYYQNAKNLIILG